MTTTIDSILFGKCAQLSKLTVNDVPPFIEIYSDNGKQKNLAQNTVGSYKLHGSFTLNGLPIYKHSCSDLYFYHDLTLNGFCVGYDPTIKNCILIFDVYNDLEALVWDTDKEEYVPSLQMKYRFLKEEPVELDTFSDIPKRIKISSVGAFGQKVWHISTYIKFYNIMKI